MNEINTFRVRFAALVPELVKMSAAKFSDLDPEGRDEAVQNTLALTWQNYAALITQHRADEPGIIKSILWYSIKQTRAGRALSRSGNTNAKDAATAAAAGKVRFEGVDLRQFVSDATPIPQAVAFRIDFPAFLATLNDRQRLMAEDLMAGERTQDVAAKFGVSPGAVSQFRTRFADMYAVFMAG